MRHGILGAGGVGGLIGAVLAHAGERVTLIVRPGTEKTYPSSLSLESGFGNLTAPVSVAPGAREPLDVLWVTVKATQLETALASVPERTEIGAVVPLLNGVDHVARLRKRFGRDRVIPATISVESEQVAPGRIAHRSPFIRLSVAAAGRPRLERAVGLLGGFGVECAWVDDETTLLWSKLVFLAPIALSTSANRSPIGPVVADRTLRLRFETAVREACAVAAAEGARGPAVDADAMVARVTGLPPGMRSSMEKDVAAGRPPELDAIAGPILRGAERHGIRLAATPALVRTVERLTGR
jgi:2-dehydropantoate 2-reductase